MRIVRTYKGTTVTPGVVSGKLFCATSIAHFDSCPKGCILALRVATPDIILALASVVGIATETGGTTCHAAIIAREFGIPCIIGAEGIASANNHMRDALLNGSEGLVYILR